MAFHLLLPRYIFEQMLHQARAELPNECCGLLGGCVTVNGNESDAKPPAARVERCYPLVNEAASSTEYSSEPKSMFAAVRDMRQRGLEIVATYHSHPTSAPIPSRTDRERNYSEDVVNFIISLEKAEPEVRGWWLTANDFREATWEVVEE